MLPTIGSITINNTQLRRRVAECRRRATLPGDAAVDDRMLACLVTGLCRKLWRWLEETAPCLRPLRVYTMHTSHVHLYLTP